jgi:hypothetical protein
MGWIKKLKKMLQHMKEIKARRQPEVTIFMNPQLHFTDLKFSSKKY